MSQINWRQRIAQQREEERQGGVSDFVPQENIGTISTAPVAATTQEPPGEQPAAQPEAAVDQVTTAALQEQASSTAAMVAQLDPEAYAEALQNLQQQNPQLYALVVDELYKMSDAAEQGEGEGEGDGYDLSGMTAQPGEAGTQQVAEPGPSPLEWAQQVAALPSEEYTARLQELEAANPGFYALVVTELQRMNEAQ